MKKETKLKRIHDKIKALQDEEFALIYAKAPTEHRFRLEIDSSLNTRDPQIARLAEELDVLSRPILRTIREIDLLTQFFDANNERANAISLALSRRKFLSRKFAPIAVVAKYDAATTDEERNQIYEDSLKTI